MSMLSATRSVEAERAPSSALLIAVIGGIAGLGGAALALWFTQGGAIVFDLALAGCF